VALNAAVESLGLRDLSGRAISAALRARKDRRVNGLRLAGATGHGGYMYWRVAEPTDAPRKSADVVPLRQAG
jgi:hypothetical protein